MRRFLVTCCSVLLVLAGMAPPAYADNTVVIKSTDVLQGTGTEPYFLAGYSCNVGPNSATGISYVIKGSNPTPVLGQRSWGFPVSTFSPPTGNFFGVGVSVNDASELGTFKLSVWGQNALEGRAVIIGVPPGTPQGDLWVGIATVAAPGGAWSVIDGANRTYSWAEYDPNNSYQPTGASAGTLTLAGFESAKGPSTQGYGALIGMGCNGEGFLYDDFQYGASGAVTTLDFEALANSVTMSGSPAVITAGATSALSGVVSSRYSGGTPGVLQAKPYGASTWSTVATLKSSTTDWTFRRSVAPLVQTSYRWFIPGSESTDPATSRVFTVNVRTALTAKIVDATLRPGQKLVVKGVTRPHKPGVAVTLWRKTATGSKVLARTSVHSDGTYKVAIPVRRKGTWKVFTTITAATGNLAGQSPVRTARVG